MREVIHHMKLETLYQIKENGKVYHAIGNGSETLRENAIIRIGEKAFYSLTEGKLRRGHNGVSINLFYFLEETDLHLFNAHDNLPEGFEILAAHTGLDKNSDRYDYLVYKPSKHTWNKTPCKLENFDIYARKLKAKAPRDLSKVQHTLARLTPKFRQKVEELAYEEKNISFPTTPKFFSDLFSWHSDAAKTGGYDNRYWSDLDTALRCNEPHPAIIPKFKWRTDKPPTEDDATAEGLVCYYDEKASYSYSLDDWTFWPFGAGMPWQTAEACNHFTEDDPAPSPFDT